MATRSPSVTIELQPLTEKDLELLMAWRSHPEAYHFFKAQTGPLQWEEHLNFWRKRKHREDFLILITDKKHTRKVGSLNLSRLDTEEPEIGVINGELTLHGKGVATKAVTLGLEWLTQKGYKKAQANIHYQNSASQRLFIKCGFTPAPNSDITWLKYEKHL